MEFLFRVFDKDFNLMSKDYKLGDNAVYWDNDIRDDLPPELEGDMGLCIDDSKRFVVMQWTGLYDGTKWEQLTAEEQKAWLDKGKTEKEWPGKSIFEGDIVKRESKYNPETYKVEWDIDSCGFEPFADSKHNCGHCGGGLQQDEVIVIGNVHQTELLEGGK